MEQGSNKNNDSKEKPDLPGDDRLVKAARKLFANDYEKMQLSNRAISNARTWHYRQQRAKLEYPNLSEKDASKAYRKSSHIKVAMKKFEHLSPEEASKKLDKEYRLKLVRRYYPNMSDEDALKTYYNNEKKKQKNKKQSIIELTKRSTIDNSNNINVEASTSYSHREEYLNTYVNYSPKRYDSGTNDFRGSSPITSCNQEGSSGSQLHDIKRAYQGFCESDSEQSYASSPADEHPSKLTMQARRDSFSDDEKSNHGQSYSHTASAISRRSNITQTTR